MELSADAIASAVHRLVDEYRSQCLWFLRPGYYPSTRDEQLRVLAYVERHGNREAFVRAALLRQWLLQHSSAESAGC